MDCTIWAAKRGPLHPQMRTGAHDQAAPARASLHHRASRFPLLHGTKLKPRQHSTSESTCARRPRRLEKRNSAQKVRCPGVELDHLRPRPPATHRNAPGWFHLRRDGLGLGSKNLRLRPRSSPSQGVASSRSTRRAQTALERPQFSNSVGSTSLPSRPSRDLQKRRAGKRSPLRDKLSHLKRGRSDC